MPLKIGILSRDRRLYTTRRLIWSAKDLGHDPIFIDTLACGLMIDDDKYPVFYEDENMGQVDILLTRVGTSITEYGLAVVRHFEMRGIPTVNSSQAIADSRDKFRCLQILSKHNVKVPKTVLTRSPAMTLRSVQLLGGPPVILKMIQGTQGIGVILADSKETTESILETFWGLGHDIQIQSFIKESKGKDIRAFVIGDEVVAAMIRQSKTGEFRANIHRGGEGKPFELDKVQEEVALKTAKVLGLKIAGIDMLETKNGPVVIEANSSPGFEGLEGATEIDIARKIIEYLVEYYKESKR